MELGKLSDGNKSLLESVGQSTSSDVGLNSVSSLFTQLLKEIKAIIDTNDTDLKTLAKSRHLVTLESKKDRQFVLIENLLLNNLPALFAPVIQQAVQEAMSGIVENVKLAVCSTINEKLTTSSVTLHKPIVGTTSRPVGKKATTSKGPSESLWSSVVCPKKNKSDAYKRLDKQQTVVGVADADHNNGEIKGKTTVPDKMYSTASLYVGNMETTTAAQLQKYIERMYETSFKSKIRIRNVFPLVKKENYNETGMSNTKATSFRLVVDSQVKSNLLNALVWPENVCIREWSYKVKAEKQEKLETNPILDPHSWPALVEQDSAMLLTCKEKRQSG